MSQIRLPDNTKRTTILGRTGAGKTVFAAGLLSRSDFVSQPWVIIDYKDDELIRDICEDNKIPQITPKDKVPTKPGLYVMRPMPKVDDALLEQWLFKVHATENCGLYVDEGYALPQADAFDIILTQGRSKRIPVISLYQRPVYMSRFAVAQADFFAVFEQNDERDLKTTKQFVTHAVSPTGQKITVYDRLPPHHCLWHDVGRGVANVLAPAPPPEQIRETFAARLRKGRKNRGYVI